MGQYYRLATHADGSVRDCETGSSGSQHWVHFPLYDVELRLA
jgi:hypothetical protein